MLRPPGAASHAIDVHVDSAQWGFIDITESGPPAATAALSILEGVGPKNDDLSHWLPENAAEQNYFGSKFC